jgi:transcription initiation factor IIE alpha subunit
VVAPYRDGGPPKALNCPRCGEPLAPVDVARPLVQLVLRLEERIEKLETRLAALEKTPKS